MGTTGRDKDCEEGWEAQRGFGTSERNLRKDRDFHEGCGPCGEMGTHKEWGGQKGRRPWGRTETPRNDGDLGTPRRAEPFLPLCHTPWAGSFLCHLRPVLPVPRPCHHEWQSSGPITPSAGPLFLFPPQPLSPRGPGEQPGGCRGSHQKGHSSVTPSLRGTGPTDHREPGAAAGAGQGAMDGPAEHHPPAQCHPCPGLPGCPGHRGEPRG